MIIKVMNLKGKWNTVVFNPDRKILLQSDAAYAFSSPLFVEAQKSRDVDSVHNGLLEEGYAEVDFDTFTRLSASKFPIAIHRNVIVEWTDCSEGLFGDYNLYDPEDIHLLRFDVSVLRGNTWEAVDDASYCTQMPADTNVEILDRAARFLAKKYSDILYNNPYASVKKLGEKLSWICPEWFTDNIPPALKPSPWRVEWETEDCADGHDAGSFEDAKSSAFEILYSWMDEERERWDGEPTEYEKEHWNWMIASCSVSIVRLDKSSGEYEEEWVPTEKELSDIGWKSFEEQL